MKKAMLAIVVALLAGGCAVVEPLREIGTEPPLSPVGAGLRPARVEIIEPVPFAPYPVAETGSLWNDGGADLFRDPRARHVGDVLTVKISMKDKASLDNNSIRSRKAKRGLGLGTSYDINLPILNWLPFLPGTGDATSTTTLEGTTATDGQGEISRSERIELLVAAVVSDVLPNGNLVISGSQEVRVNYEDRLLSVGGIVRPRDISADNSISYEKIAEARISYGGRGRIMEVQQPAWGQQAFDILSPL